VRPELAIGPGQRQDPVGRPDNRRRVPTVGSFLWRGPSTRRPQAGRGTGQLHDV